MRVIKKQFGREELISRIPALFAYLEADDAGEFHLHKATDAPQGCWGKIIADIKVPDTAALIVDGVTLVEANKVYSYRTLINLYYKYRADYSDQGFIKFIDKYIGLVDNTVEQTKERDLMPSKVYLADVRNLYKIYGAYHVIYQKYYADYSDDKKQRELDHSICCAIKKYIRMGDDKMYNFLGTLFTEMNTRADDAYKLANNTLNNETWYKKGNSPLISEWEREHMPDTDEYEEVENPFDADAHVSLMINLNQSQNDLGILSCYLNPWVPGEQHFKSDLYTYEGNTYICLEDNHDYFDERTGKIVFDPPQYDSTPVTNAHFKKLSEDYADKVITSKDPNGGKKKASSFIIKSTEDSKLKGLRRFTKYINEVGEYEEVPEGEDWLYFYRKGLVMNYSYITDEKGNIADIYTYESSGETIAATSADNLAAYGDVITKIEAVKDVAVFYYLYNTHAAGWGNVITKEIYDSLEPVYQRAFRLYEGDVYERTGSNQLVTADKYNSLSEDKKQEYKLYVITEIRFTYVIGGHLRATRKSVDENGKVIWSNFQYKDGGVIYTETYNYEEGGELDELIKSEDPNLNFANYIDGTKSDKTRFNFKKYSFSLLNSMCITKVDTGKERLDWSYVGTDSEVKDGGVVDYMYADIMKYDYLTGITYKPEVNTSVYIDRGNYSAFERHIALSQINTMEDLEAYRNGGFFNIQKVN